ncbi:16S rRNA (cytidine(1402)-2'-O)-methyltransferase [Thiomicrorhabdus arctica]|jgi:16S rRNA (cytidine1402-2'-O)-methyltransferase|uniref:16S rRNA (cytidine(1402)-2'-O)-methyltransferase n=1 Tax=Thiomicrorhabdus arctica TaxID=131540 RepID=UPI0003798673|nr:16S rRNA (cytidine(1402)-2'-O)-methyltransferase [Thiomicrorhabdus arctica]
MTHSTTPISGGTGILYIVATPIGNLKDITRRAVEILESVDWVAAEDTRHTRPLLQYLGMNKTLISLHEHNEKSRSEQLLEKLRNGENGALVSDAGTPLINDPGYYLVKLLREKGVDVVPIPGPSAVITALCAAGLPTARFSYEGFLPAKSNKRLAVLATLVDDVRTLVFYESPHRVITSLADFQTAFGSDREMVVARELTKKFEQFVSGTIAEVVEYFTENQDKVRGEFVFMLSGAEEKEVVELSTMDELILTLLKQNLPVKQISEIVADYAGIKKKPIYNRVLELKKE